MDRSWRALALVVGAVLFATGCQEDLAGGAACPSLCADTLALRDTVLFADSIIEVDSTLRGYPPLGTEPQLLVANYTQGGNRVQSVAVVRFDRLAQTLPPTDSTQPPKVIDRVDTASMTINVLPAPTGKDTIFVQDTVVFQIFDVDVDAPDLDTAAVRERFSATPIATRAVPRDSVKGAIRIPLDSGFVAPRVRAGTRIRLGINAVSNRDFRVRISSVEGGSGATLGYFGFADTSRAFLTVTANTKAQEGPTIPALADYTLILQGSPPPPPDVLAAGGLPSSRVYLRFKLPAAFLDSATTVVRANLELAQLPDPNFVSGDSLSLVPRVVRASTSVTDVAQAAELLADPTFLSLRAISVAPDVARRDTISLVNLARLWELEDRRQLQHAIVLQSSGEGTDPRQILVASSRAADPDLRPRLRLSYIPHSGFGLP